MQDGMYRVTSNNTYSEVVHVMMCSVTAVDDNNVSITVSSNNGR